MASVSPSNPTYHPFSGRFDSSQSQLVSRHAWSAHQQPLNVAPIDTSASGGPYVHHQPHHQLHLHAAPFVVDPALLDPAPITNSPHAMGMRSHPPSDPYSMAVPPWSPAHNNSPLAPNIMDEGSSSDALSPVSPYDSEFNYWPEPASDFDDLSPEEQQTAAEGFRQILARCQQATKKPSAKDFILPLESQALLADLEQFSPFSSDQSHHSFESGENEQAPTEDDYRSRPGHLEQGAYLSPHHDHARYTDYVPPVPTATFEYTPTALVHPVDPRPTAFRIPSSDMEQETSPPASLSPPRHIFMRSPTPHLPRHEWIPYSPPGAPGPTSPHALFASPTQHIYPSRPFTSHSGMSMLPPPAISPDTIHPTHSSPMQYISSQRPFTAPSVMYGPDPNLPPFPPNAGGPYFAHGLPQYVSLPIQNQADVGVTPSSQGVVSGLEMYRQNAGTPIAVASPGFPVLQGNNARQSSPPHTKRRRQYSTSSRGARALKKAVLGDSEKNDAKMKQEQMLKEIEEAEESEEEAEETGSQEVKEGKKKSKAKEEDSETPSRPPVEKPPKKPPSAWQLYFKDWVTRHLNVPRGYGKRMSVHQEAKLAATVYQAMTDEEKEPWEEKAVIKKKEYQVVLNAWKRKLRPEDIRAENIRRTAQRKSGASKRTNMRDPNIPPKPLSAYFLYQADIRADPEMSKNILQGETRPTEQSKLAAEHWKAMSPENKRFYLERAERAKRDWDERHAVYLELVAQLPPGTDLSGVFPTSEQAHEHIAIKRATLSAARTISYPSTRGVDTKPDSTELAELYPNTPRKA